jgi:hypothetical protein
MLSLSRSRSHNFLFERASCAAMCTPASDMASAHAAAFADTPHGATGRRFAVDPISISNQFGIAHEEDWQMPNLRGSIALLEGPPLCSFGSPELIRRLPANENGTTTQSVGCCISWRKHHAPYPHDAPPFCRWHRSHDGRRNRCSLRPHRLRCRQPHARALGSLGARRRERPPIIPIAKAAISNSRLPPLRHRRA